MSREAMQMALEALESDPISHSGLVNRKQAIAALRQALEKQWVGLTDEEISDLWCEVSNTDFVTIDTHEFAKVIESKLKEKNHG